MVDDLVSGNGRLAGESGGVADISDDQLERLTMSFFEPGDILFGAAAGEVVENGYLVAAAHEPIDEIGSDKTGATCDKNRTCSDVRVRILRNDDH